MLKNYKNHLNKNMKLMSNNNKNKQIKIHKNLVIATLIFNYLNLRSYLIDRQNRYTKLGKVINYI